MWWYYWNQIGLFHISWIYLITYFFRIFYKRLFHGDIRLCWKSLFRSNTKTSVDKADYKEPSLNTNTNYQELNPKTVYQELNPNANYQALKVPYVDENEYQNTTLWHHKMYLVIKFCNFMIGWICRTQIKGV